MYDLGMDDFVDDSAFKNKKENWVLSLSLRKKARTNAPSPSKCPCMFAIVGGENLAERFESRFEFSDDETYRTRRKTTIGLTITSWRGWRLVIEHIPTLHVH
jgi:hypothetical protein